MQTYQKKERTRKLETIEFFVLFSSWESWSLSNSRNAKWSCAKLFLFHDLFSNFHRFKVSSNRYDRSNWFWIRSQISGFTRSRSFRKRLIIVLQFVAASLVAYSRLVTRIISFRNLFLFQRLSSLSHGAAGRYRSCRWYWFRGRLVLLCQYLFHAVRSLDSRTSNSKVFSRSRLHADSTTFTFSIRKRICGSEVKFSIERIDEKFSFFSFSDGAENDEIIRTKIHRPHLNKRFFFCFSFSPIEKFDWFPFCCCQKKRSELGMHRFRF